MKQKNLKTKILFVFSVLYIPVYCFCETVVQFFGSLICVNMNYIQKAIFFMDSTFSGRRLLAKKVLLE